MPLLERHFWDPELGCQKCTGVSSSGTGSAGLAKYAPTSVSTAKILENSDSVLLGFLAFAIFAVLPSTANNGGPGIFFGGGALTQIL